ATRERMRWHLPTLRSNKYQIAARNCHAAIKVNASILEKMQPYLQILKTVASGGRRLIKGTALTRNLPRSEADRSARQASGPRSCGLSSSTALDISPRP